MPKLINLDNLEEYSIQLKAVLDKYIKSPDESVKNIVVLTSAEYQQLVDDEEVDPDTEYHIEDSNPSLDDIQQALDYLQNQINNIKGAGETLPVGSEIAYFGTAANIPDGWEVQTDQFHYSTSEIKTNKTWIDNKPIYRKVIQYDSLSANSEVRIDISSLNFDTIIYVNGFQKGGANFDHIPMLFYNSNWSYLYVENKKLVMKTGWAATNIYVFLEYTKTTD